jgi:hypothetical protein
MNVFCIFYFLIRIIPGMCEDIKGCKSKNRYYNGQNKQWRKRGMTTNNSLHNKSGWTPTGTKQTLVAPSCYC